MPPYAAEKKHDDVIIRYEKGQVVGMIFLNASKRQKPQS